MLVKANQGAYGRGQGNKRKDSKKDDRVCDHCKAIGHTRDSRFKIHGYPEWFKQLRKEKGNTSNAHLNLANSPFEEGDMADKKGNGTRLSPTLSPGLLELVQQEVNKIMKGEQSGAEQVNFRHIPKFAGNIYHELYNIYENTMGLLHTMTHLP